MTGIKAPFPGSMVATATMPDGNRVARIAGMKTRIRPIVYREPSSGEIVTMGIAPAGRRIATWLVAAILTALALVTCIVWILM